MPVRVRCRRATRVRVGAVVVAVGLLAAACGGGGRSSEDAETESGSTPGTGGTTSSEVTFGTVPSPCGPADDGTAGGAATEQGLTESTITIGYGDDAGYQASPGLNSEMSSAVTAMMEWCNEQGGINGRTVEGVYYDGKITEANNVMTEACGQVFMLVGQGFALDGAAEQTRVGCDLPSVAGYAVSGAVASGPKMFQPLPSPPDENTIGAGYQLAAEFPEEVKKASIVYGDYATTVETRDRAKASFPEAGWTFLECDQAYPFGAAVDWRPIVQRLSDCGTEVVYFTGAPAPNFQNLLDAAAGAGFDPIYMVERNFYDEAFAAWNQQGNADKVYVNTQVVPFHLADDNQAIQDYLEIIERVDGKASLLGAFSASAFLLWATAVDECGADVSRECVVAELEEIIEWDGGGIHALSNPGENETTRCAMTLLMQGTEFQQWAPAEQGQFECDPKYVVPISIPATEAAKLGPDGRSQVYTGG